LEARWRWRKMSACGHSDVVENVEVARPSAITALRTEVSECCKPYGERKHPEC
jgi:hypothetical protein